MILTEETYIRAKKQRLLAKRCEFEGKPCEWECLCPIVYTKGNIAGIIIET